MSNEDNAIELPRTLQQAVTQVANGMVHLAQVLTYIKENPEETNVSPEDFVSVLRVAVQSTWTVVSAWLAHAANSTDVDDMIIYSALAGQARGDMEAKLEERLEMVGALAPELVDAFKDAINLSYELALTEATADSMDRDDIDARLAKIEALAVEIENEDR